MFSYVISTKVEDKFFNVAEMLTEDHHQYSISHWLYRIRLLLRFLSNIDIDRPPFINPYRNILPADPAAVVVDHCFALLNALVLHFHNMELIDYVNLDDEVMRKKLPVVKICRNHELKAVLDSVKHPKTADRRFVKNVCARL